MVTKANNYNVLVGNDWLRMAGSDLMLSQGVLRDRLAPDHYKEVQVDTKGDFPNVHVVQSKDPRGGAHSHPMSGAEPTHAVQHSILILCFRDSRPAY